MLARRLFRNKHCAAGYAGISMKIPMEGLARELLSSPIPDLPFSELVLGTFVFPLRFQYGLNT
jgi:hypothetical protein